MKSICHLSESFSLLYKMPLSKLILKQPKYIMTSYYVRNYCLGQTINDKTSESSAKSSDDLHSSSSSSSSSNEEENETEEEEKLRLKILDASLPFVNESGWASESISKGAESLGYSSMIHGMFQNGGIDLVNFHYMKCNTKLENILKDSVEKSKVEKKDIERKEFIQTAVETRLRMNTEYMSTWAKAMALHASPSNFPVNFENLGNIVDTIWYYAGDRSVDSTWYARRGSLLVIYKSSELCMLQDTSDDFRETWSFLSRRLNEVSAVDKGVNRVFQGIDDACSVAKVGVITVQNILGLNKR